MTKLSKVITYLLPIVALGIIGSFFCLSIAEAATAELLGGTVCGMGAAWGDNGKADNSYKEYWKKKKGASDVACASGWQCMPDECDMNKREVEYKCLNPKESFSQCGTGVTRNDAQYNAAEIKKCSNGTDPSSDWKKRCTDGSMVPTKPTDTNNQSNTNPLASCKRKAPTERGIFTRGLSDECLGCGNCSQCDVLQVISSITSFIFSLVGALAIFFIVNAGFSFALSGGNEEHLKKAKGALAAAIIGAILVLVAWALINTVLSFWLGYDANSLGNWAYPNFSCSSS